MLSGKDKKYLQQVLERYGDGRATPAEVHFVETYMNYLDRMAPADELSGQARQDIEAEIREKLLGSIRQEGAPAPLLKVRHGRGFTWRVAAAVVFALVGAATCWVLLQRSYKQPAVTAAHDLLPGKEKAVLKLASGQLIVLDSSRGQIARSGGLTVNNDSGSLNYRGKADMAELHTLSVPPGGQYQLLLPDGTHVWLNATSSITYPTAFTGAERMVAVTGEAYFEVAPMKQKPFRVKSARGSEIEVLGTHFNINAYADEPSVTATLLEGRIKFSRAGEHHLMKPGQQARLNNAGVINISSNANTEAAIAWKEGYFYFDGADLQMVMRQIARWYNVTVVYEGKIPGRKFSGEISKTNNVSLVLQMLEANRVRFEIDGNRIIVRE